MELTEEIFLDLGVTRHTRLSYDLANTNVYYVVVLCLPRTGKNSLDQVFSVRVTPCLSAWVSASCFMSYGLPYESLHALLFDIELDM